MEFAFKPLERAHFALSLKSAGGLDGMFRFEKRMAPKTGKQRKAGAQ